MLREDVEVPCGVTIWTKLHELNWSKKQFHAGACRPCSKLVLGSTFVGALPYCMKWWEIVIFVRWQCRTDFPTRFRHFHRDVVIQCTLCPESVTGVVTGHFIICQTLQAICFWDSLAAAGWLSTFRLAMVFPRRAEEACESSCLASISIRASGQVRCCKQGCCKQGWRRLKFLKRPFILHTLLEPLEKSRLGCNVFPAIFLVICGNVGWAALGFLDEWPQRS